MNSTVIEIQSCVFPCRGILFDLDGTLVDTSRDLWISLQSALKHHDIPPITSDDFFQTLHYGIEKSVDLILEIQKADPRLLDPVVIYYKKQYQQLEHQHTTLYEGVTDLLDQCLTYGLKLGICTNKERHPTIDVLRKLNIEHYFDVVLGLDQVTRPKPAPDPVLQVFEMMRLPTSLGVFIGDSPLDANASRAANVPFILHQVGFGAADVSPLLVDGCFHSYSELRVSSFQNG